MDTIKKISIKEFQEKGYLQEVNRRFLHCVGLALSVDYSNNEDGEFGPIWDCRDDPEGIVYANLAKKSSKEKEKFIREQINKYARYRKDVLKFQVQPIGTTVKQEDLIKAKRKYAEKKKNA